MIELNEINAERSRMPTKRFEVNSLSVLEIFAVVIVFFVLF